MGARLVTFTPSPPAGEGRGEGFGRVGSMPTRTIGWHCHPLPALTRFSFDKLRITKSAQPSPVKGEGAKHGEAM